MSNQYVPAAAPRAELTQSTGPEEALIWLRDILGTVAPRDPRTRMLGERRHRLDLLVELCERETFLLAASWLGSNAVPAVKSKQAYADDLRVWSGVARELGGHERFFIGSITPEMIETWTKVQRSRKAAPNTINRRLSTLTAFTRYVAWKRKETGLHTPVSKHDRCKIDLNDETTATPILEVDELQAVIKAAATPCQALVPVFIYTLAGRVSECCNAQLTQLKEQGDRTFLDLRRKGDKGRVWPIPDMLLQLIHAAADGRKTGSILLTDDGRPMDRHTIDRLLTKLGRTAGVLKGRDLTPHVLRASKLTHMHDDNVKVEEIQEYANHVNIETTLRYIRRRDESLRRAEHAESSVAVYGHLVERFISPESEE